MNLLFKWLDKVGVAGSLVALACCLGLSGIVAFLSAIGVGFLVNDTYLIPLLIVFLAVGAVGLFRSFRRHAKPQALGLYILSSAAILFFLMVRFNRPMLYVAALGLIAASVWDMLIHKRQIHGQ